MFQTTNQIMFHNVPLKMGHVSCWSIAVQHRSRSALSSDLQRFRPAAARLQVTSGGDAQMLDPSYYPLVI